jgi:putative hemolysin
MLALEISVIFLLIALNGFFAMSELAVVSANRVRLKSLVKLGVRGSRRALALAERPGRFLSTVQIGITLAGVFAGAYSGATVAGRLAGHLEIAGVPDHLSDSIALASVVAVITYLSLILGELVPKQIALHRAEKVATAVAPAMTFIARLGSPFVWLLDTSSAFVLRRLGAGVPAKASVTEEEIKILVAEAEASGAVEPEEKDMITRVMRLGDRPVRAIMTPRRDVDWIDLDADDAEIRATIRRTPHSRLAAAHGYVDAVVGIVHTKDVLNAYIDGGAVDVRRFVTKAPIVPDGVPALEIVDVFKASEVHIALVVDEHGTFEGVVTTTDILSAIAGEFREAGETSPAGPVQRDDGSWLLDGDLPVEELAGILGLSVPEDRDFHTVAGLVLWQLKHLPEVGESFVADGWRFEVVDTDGRRIDKVLAQKI